MTTIILWKLSGTVKCYTFIHKCNLNYLVNSFLNVVILKDFIHFTITTVDTLCITFCFEHFHYIISHNGHLMSSPYCKYELFGFTLIAQPHPNEMLMNKQFTMLSDGKKIAHESQILHSILTSIFEHFTNLLHVKNSLLIHSLTYSN